MPQFLEIIPDRLFQGSYPEPFAFRPFNIVINVSDCDHGSIDTDEDFINSLDFSGEVKKTIRHRLDFARHFWFPVNETGKWDYAAFFGAKRVMDKILMSPGASMMSSERKQSVLVHCSAGAYRSVLVTYGWLYSHGLEHLMAEDEPLWQGFIAGKRAPKEICTFLKMMNEHPTYGIGGILAQCGFTDQLMVKDHPVQ